MQPGTKLRFNVRACGWPEHRIAQRVCWRRRPTRSLLRAFTYTVSGPTVLVHEVLGARGSSHRGAILRPVGRAAVPRAAPQRTAGRAAGNP